MKKQEKIAMYMQKGLTKEQAERLIWYNYNDYLTVEELAIKYDNPKLLTHEYPDWLTKEKHLEICGSVAKSEYRINKFIFTQMTEYDLKIELFIWSTVRLFKFKNEAALKFGLRNRVKNIIRQGMKHNTSKLRKEDLITEQQKLDDYYYERVNGEPYLALSLDQKISNTEWSEDVSTFMDIVNVEKETDYDKYDIFASIEQISSKVLKDIIIVCGYLLAEIDELYPKVVQVMKTNNTSIKTNIQNLCEQQLNYNNYKYAKANKLPYTKVNKVTMEDIIIAFNTEWEELCVTDEELDNVKTVHKLLKEEKTSTKSLKQQKTLLKKLSTNIVFNIQHYLQAHNFLGLGT